MDFAHWYFGQPLTIVNKILFSEEAYFPLVQPLNRQNNRIWSKEKPTEGLEYPLYEGFNFLRNFLDKGIWTILFSQQCKSAQLP